MKEVDLSLISPTNGKGRHFPQIYCIFVLLGKFANNCIFANKHQLKMAQTARIYIAIATSVAEFEALPPVMCACHTFRPLQFNIPFLGLALPLDRVGRSACK